MRVFPWKKIAPRSCDGLVMDLTSFALINEAGECSRRDNLWLPLFPQHARDTPRHPPHIQEQHEAKQLDEMDEAPPLDHFYLHDDQQDGCNQKDEYVFAGALQGPRAVMS